MLSEFDFDYLSLLSTEWLIQNHTHSQSKQRRPCWSPLSNNKSDAIRLYWHSFSQCTGLRDTRCGHSTMQFNNYTTIASPHRVNKTDIDKFFFIENKSLRFRSSSKCSFQHSTAQLVKVTPSVLLLNRSFCFLQLQAIPADMYLLNYPRINQVNTRVPGRDSF